MDYGILNVRTDVNACDCTRGCTDTVRESALKVEPGRKIPCRTGGSNLRQRRDGPMFLYPTELHPTPYSGPLDHVNKMADLVRAKGINQQTIVRVNWTR